MKQLYTGWWTAQRRRKAIWNSRTPWPYHGMDVLDTSYLPGVRSSHALALAGQAYWGRPMSRRERTPTAAAAAAAARCWLLTTRNGSDRVRTWWRDCLRKSTEWTVTDTRGSSLVSVLIGVLYRLLIRLAGIRRPWLVSKCS